MCLAVYQTQTRNVGILVGTRVRGQLRVTPQGAVLSISITDYEVE